MIRLQQAVIMLVAAVIAGIMIMLGMWQMQVFRSQGDAEIAARAAAPAVPLDQVASAGQESPDGYGRQVTFSGSYDTSRQYLIPVPARPGHYRVLTALVRADGSLVPVIRGESSDATPPPPPEGSVEQQGLFLASEASTEESLPAGQIGSVRLATIAQTWQTPMVPGFVTLDRDYAYRQGMTQADVTLPQGQGHLRNGGYALQWWVFAGFGFVMAGKMARDVGRRREWDQLSDTDDTTTPQDEVPGDEQRSGDIHGSQDEQGQQARAEDQ